MNNEVTCRTKLPLFLMILIFLFLSLACNLPRTLLDRDDFLCEEVGGNWVTNQKGTKCEFDSPNAEEPSPEAGTQQLIPAGTYEGLFIDTEMGTKGLVEWKVQGTVGKNEVVITVADDGTVSGQFTYEVIGNILVSDDGGGSHAPCISSNDQFFKGDASGQLTTNQGRVVFEIQQTIVSRLTEGCSVGPSEKTKVINHKQHFEVEIKDLEMIGISIPSVEDGHPVKATFRLVKN